MLKKCRFLKRYGHYKVGEVAKLQPNQVSSLAKYGIVEEVIDDSPARECAALEIVGETAVLPAPRKRGRPKKVQA